MRILSMVFTVLLLGLLKQTTTAPDKPRQCPTTEVVKDSEFIPGQVWKYKTRENEEGSTLTILKIESLHKAGTIIHVRVDKIRLKNCTGGPEPNKFEHMPFTRSYRPQRHEDGKRKVIFLILTEHTRNGGRPAVAFTQLLWRKLSSE